MHNTPTPTAIAGAVPDSCALESELLNSERIRERFGSCGIDVLEHGPTARRSSLFSLENDERVCRSYAVVQFAGIESPDVLDAHKKILAGESIGATFKSAGWKIRKVTRHVGLVPAPAGEHDAAKLMRLRGNESLAMHAYRLILEQHDRSLHYATIIEVHHPDYLGEPELRRLYDWSDDNRLADSVIDELASRVWG